MKLDGDRMIPDTADATSRPPVGVTEADQQTFERMSAEGTDQASPASGWGPQLLKKAQNLGERFGNMLSSRIDVANATGSRPEMKNIARHVAASPTESGSFFFKEGNVLHAIGRAPDAERNAARAIVNAAARDGLSVELHGGDRNGEAPLTTAVRKQNLDAAMILKEMGASPDHTDGTGRTPRQIAQERLTEAEVSMRFGGRSMDEQKVRHKVEQGDVTAQEYQQAKQMVSLLQDDNKDAGALRSILEQESRAQEPQKRVRFADEPDRAMTDRSRGSSLGR